jgi:hypothetical protein
MVAGQPRIAIRVDAHCHVILANQALNLGVAVRALVHHMTPVAPHRVQVEQDKSVFFGRLREQPVVPSALPYEGYRSVCGARDQGRAQCKDRADRWQT